MNVSFTDTESELQGEKCFIYHCDKLFLLAHGTFTFNNSTGIVPQSGLPIPNQQDEIGAYRITIKNLTNELSNEAYIVKVLYKNQDSFFVLELNSLVWKNKAGNLEAMVSLKELVLNKISDQEFNSISNDKYTFDWSKLIVPTDCSGKKQADAFEDMVTKLILTSPFVENFNRIGLGTDRGRDGAFEVNITPWLKQKNISSKWVLQCKYSENTKTKLTIEEMYKEMTKVLMHQPDGYLIVTNRKLTNDFADWFNSNLMQNTNYFIPFKKMLIQREEIEAMLSQPENSFLRKTYFD